jgi:drug/metabolite transporter (DMT)-like permease
MPSMNPMNRLVGILLIILSAAAFGTLGILGRFAFAEELDSLSIMALRFSLAALLLLVVLLFRGERMPRGGNLLRLVGMGAIGYVGQAFAYLTALKYASPGLVALLLYLYPVFVVILSVVFHHEPVNRIKIFALGLALVGLALTVGPEGGQLPGILLAISAAAIYSVYIIVGTQVMQQVSAIQSSAVIFLSAGVMSSLLMMVNGAHLPQTARGWIVIGAIVTIATVIPVVTFLAGLKRIGASNAAMFSTLEPVVTVLLAALLLGEILKPITLVGGALILAAVLILLRNEMRHPPDEKVGEERS